MDEAALVEDKFQNEPNDQQTRPGDPHFRSLPVSAVYLRQISEPAQRSSTERAELKEGQEKSRDELSGAGLWQESQYGLLEVGNS